MLDLNEVNLADDDSNDASEHKGKNVKEDEEKQVWSSTSKVVDLLPLEVVTLYISCRQIVILVIWASERYVNQPIRDPINNSKDCRVGQLTKETRSCHVIISFTKVGSIWPIEDYHKTGKIRKRHNDPEALVDHQDLGVLSQLALVKSYPRWPVGSEVDKLDWNFTMSLYTSQK